MWHTTIPRPDEASPADAIHGLAERELDLTRLDEDKLPGLAIRGTDET